MSLFDFFEDIAYGIADIVDDITDFTRDRVDDLIDITMDVGSVAIEVGELISGKSLVDYAEIQLQQDVDRFNALVKNYNELVEKCNSNLSVTSENYDKIIKKAMMQKEHVFRYVLEPYIEIVSTLRGNAKLERLPKVKLNTISDLNKLDKCFSEKSCTGYCKELCIIPGVSILQISHSVKESLKIECEIDKMKEKTAKLQVEIAQMNAKCKAINQVSNFLESSYYFIEELENESKNALFEIRNLVDRKGRNMNDYSEYDFEIIQRCSNIVIALNEIVRINILQETGIINPAYKRYIETLLDKDR